MLSHHKTYPRHTLVTLFLIFKVLLLYVAIGTSVTGPSYDTSTTLFFNRSETATSGSLVTRLVRWDALYFVSQAQRGYVYEQEWAFGPGLPALMASLANVPKSIGYALGSVLGAEVPNNGVLEASAGILVAHLAHFGAVLALYELTKTLFGEQGNAKGLPFYAAVMHILSPAGIFLSAPYAESSFAFLSFVGSLLLAKAAVLPHTAGLWRRASLQIAAGAVFGLATIFRANGILNGVLFAGECLYVVLAPFVAGSGSKGDSVSDNKKADTSKTPGLAELVGPVLGGLLVAAGSVIPQGLAYVRYCSSEVTEPREWCHNTLPSIYAFVQSHYWGTGFLRYWTWNNAPLFLIATPMILIMLKSGVDLLRDPAGLGIKANGDGPSSSQGPRQKGLVASLAAAQIALVVTTLANYHVQVITRLASGYPAWYWWVAACLAGQDVKGKVWGERIIMFGTMYAIIQGGLFACFLPPA